MQTHIYRLSIGFFGFLALTLLASCSEASLPETTTLASADKVEVLSTLYAMNLTELDQLHNKLYKEIAKAPTTEEQNSLIVRELIKLGKLPDVKPGSIETQQNDLPGLCGAVGLNSVECDLIAEENRFWIPMQLVRVRELAEVQMRDRRNKFPPADTKRFVSGFGLNDAFKHTYWNAQLARTLGEKLAKKWTDAHECRRVDGSIDASCHKDSFEPAPPKYQKEWQAWVDMETQMDLNNNAVGRRLAAKRCKGKARKALADCVEEAFLGEGSGNLVMIEGSPDDPGCETIWTDKAGLVSACLVPVKEHPDYPESEAGFCSTLHTSGERFYRDVETVLGRQLPYRKEGSECLNVVKPVNLHFERKGTYTYLEIFASYKEPGTKYYIGEGTTGYTDYPAANRVYLDRNKSIWIDGTFDTGGDDGPHTTFTLDVFGFEVASRSEGTRVLDGSEGVAAHGLLIDNRYHRLFGDGIYGRSYRDPKYTVLTGPYIEPFDWINCESLLEGYSSQLEYPGAFGGIQRYGYDFLDHEEECDKQPIVSPRTKTVDISNMSIMQEVTDESGRKTVIELGKTLSNTEIWIFEERMTISWYWYPRFDTVQEFTNWLYKGDPDDTFHVIVDYTNKWCKRTNSCPDIAGATAPRKE